MSTPASDQGRDRDAEILGWGRLDPPGWEPMWLAWSDAGLRHLGWRDPALELVPVPTVYATPLLGYFSGDPVDLNQIAVDPIGTDFQRKVWDALRGVPRGTVRSYAGIAADVATPRGMRAVGAANGANPIAIVIPCHRIVEAGMKLGGYSGGLDRKRRLLELEGVRIVGDAVQPGQLTLL